MCQRSVQGVTDGKVDGDLEQIVLQNDEPVETLIPCTKSKAVNKPIVHVCCVREDGFEGIVRDGSIHLAASDFPIYKIDKSKER